MGPHKKKSTLGTATLTKNHVFQVDGVKSGEAEKNKIWALQRLTKDWSSYNLSIYTDGSVTNSTEIGGGGILITSDHQSNPTIHLSYAILAGPLCSSFQADMKAIKKALQIIQTEKSSQKVQIVRNSQSDLLCIANLQPAIAPKSADKSDITNLLAALHDERHQITFTWCPSHYSVVGNEMADEEAQKELQPIKTSDTTMTAKATIRRATKGGNHP